MTETTNKRPGLVTFASIMMFIVGGLLLVWSIEEFFNGAWLADVSFGLFGRQFFIWAIIDLVLLAGNAAKTQRAGTTNHAGFMYDRSLLETLQQVIPGFAKIWQAYEIVKEDHNVFEYRNPILLLHVWPQA